jgi:Rrf2 family protein
MFAPGCSFQQETAVSTSTRFAVAIHILTNITLQRGKAVRSEDIANSVKTNPTVVRRILSTLADAGLTQAQLGMGGGALLARPAEQITLLDVYRAVEEPPFFALHRSPPNQGCYIGHNITPVLEREFQRLTQTLDEALAQTSMADIVRQVEANAGAPYMDAKPGT